MADDSTPASGASLDIGALLDALPDATAVLEPNGRIVAVNRAWRMFSRDNGGDPIRTGVGSNYLDVCTRAANNGSTDAAKAIIAIGLVADGSTVESDFEYPCPSPTVDRWYAMRVTAIAGREPRLLVGHVNITRRKLAETDLERRANRDPLTGLGNRALFSERLQATLMAGRGLQPAPDIGLIYIDLDHFKPVNDRFGHAAGDEVLQQAAARLRSVARSEDTLARLGGDEFALLAPRMTPDGLAALCERVHELLAVPHLVSGEAVVVGGSVGAHLAARGDSMSDVIRLADDQMYAAKRSGRRHDN